MNWKTLKAPFKALVIVAVCAISLWAVIPVQKKIHLGLDLQGGARLLLQLYPDRRSAADHAASPGADARGDRPPHQRLGRRRALDQQRRQRPHPGRASGREGSRSSREAAQSRLRCSSTRSCRSTSCRRPNRTLCDAAAAEPLGQGARRGRALRLEDGVRQERPGRLLRQRSQGRAGRLRSVQPSRHPLPDQGSGQVRQADDGESREAAGHLPRPSLHLGADRPEPDLRQRRDHRQASREEADDHARQRAQRRRAAGQHHDHREGDDRSDARQDRPRSIDARCRARARVSS